MNPEVKEKWITALRSGKYKQAQNYLRLRSDCGGVSFCCLGVLCDIYQEEVGGGWGDYVTHSKIPSSTFRDAEGNGSSWTLPHGVTMWAGLETDDPEVMTELGTHRSLSALNDDAGFNFEKIADAIERGL